MEKKQTPLRLCSSLPCLEDVDVHCTEAVLVIRRRRCREMIFEVNSVPIDITRAHEQYRCSHGLASVAYALLARTDG